MQVYGFSSAKKMASVLVSRGNGKLRLYNKGASEWVLDICTHMHDTDGAIVPLTSDRKAEILGSVTEMASRGLRTLVRSPPSLPGLPAGTSFLRSMLWSVGAAVATCGDASR